MDKADVRACRVAATAALLQRTRNQPFSDANDPLPPVVLQKSGRSWMPLDGLDQPYPFAVGGCLRGRAASCRCPGAAVAVDAGGPRGNDGILYTS